MTGAKLIKTGTWVWPRPLGSSLSLKPKHLTYSTCIQNLAAVDHSTFSHFRVMVGAHQNLNGSCDLTTPLSGTICHLRARTSYCQPAYQIWSRLSPPTVKIWKGIQNLENGVVWSSYGSRMSLKIAPFNRAHRSSYSHSIVTISVLHLYWDIARKSPIWTYPTSIRVHPNGCAKQRWGRLKSSIFDQYPSISQKRCKLLWNANRNLYALYQMMLLPLTLTIPNQPICNILYRLSYLHSEWR